MTDELLVLGMFAVILVFVAIFAMVQPALTRRDLLFGVTVAPGTRATREGRGIIVRYQLLTVALTLLGLAALVAAWVWLPPDIAIAVSAFAAIAIVLISGLPYLWAYYAARRLARSQPLPTLPAPAAERPSAELRPRHYGDYVPWLWELLPLAIIAATVVYLVVTYPSVPAVFPSHFDLNGHVNGHSTKSVASYFSMVWTQLSLEVLITGLALLIVGSRALPGEAELRFRRAWLRFLYVLKVSILALMGVIAVGIGYAATSGNGLPAAFVLVPLGLLLLLVLVGSLVLAVRMGQGGVRLSPEAPATDRTSDRYWILGSIYINRSDPSLFVERRFGIGWTLNLGNPVSWLVVALIVVLVGGASVIAIVASGAH